MRLVQLLRLAGQAEALRWRRTGRGYAIKAGLGAGAAVFALMLLFMLHIALFSWLARGQGAVWAALIVAFVDLVLLALLGYLATRTTLDPVALEAERVRDEALAEAKGNTARAMMLAPLLRSQTAKKGIIGAAVTAGVVGLLTRRR